MLARLQEFKQNYQKITAKEFLTAAKNHNLAKITHYISEHENDADRSALNVIDKHGRTALMLAVINNDLEIYSKLINAGADVNIKDNYGKYALYYALKNQANFFIVSSRMFSESLSLFEKTTYIYNPTSIEDKRLAALALQILAMSPPFYFNVYKQVMVNMLANGLDPNFTNEDGLCALNAAVQLARYDCVKLLLKQNNINTEQLGFMDFTPLRLALFELNLEHFDSTLLNVLRLLGKHADVNAKNPAGIPLLTEAVNYYADYLLRENGVHPIPANILYDKKFLPILTLLESEKLSEVMVTDQLPIIWEAVLYAAAKNGNNVLLKNLIAAGVRPNYKNVRTGTGDSVLTMMIKARNDSVLNGVFYQHASQEVKSKILEKWRLAIFTLLEECANQHMAIDFDWVPNPRNYHQSELPALLYATKENDFEIVNKLLEMGASFFVKKPKTIFHVAVECENKLVRKELISKLIDYGKNLPGFLQHLNTRINGQSALMDELLDGSADSEVAVLLLTAGANKNDLLEVVDIALKNKDEKHQIKIAECLKDIYAYKSEFFSLKELKKYYIRLRDSCELAATKEYANFELAHLTLFEEKLEIEELDFFEEKFETEPPSDSALLREGLGYAFAAGENCSILQEFALDKLLALNNNYTNNNQSPWFSFYNQKSSNTRSEVENLEQENKLSL